MVSKEGKRKGASPPPFARRPATTARPPLPPRGRWLRATCRPGRARLGGRRGGGSVGRSPRAPTAAMRAREGGGRRRKNGHPRRRHPLPARVRRARSVDSPASRDRQTGGGREGERGARARPAPPAALLCFGRAPHRSPPFPPPPPSLSCSPGRSGRRRQDHHPVQAEAGRDCDHDSDDRCEREKRAGGMIGLPLRARGSGGRRARPLCCVGAARGDRAGAVAMRAARRGRRGRANRKDSAPPRSLLSPPPPPFPFPPSPPGFNVETVEYKNISFTVWDVGGQDKVRRRREGKEGAKKKNTTGSRGDETHPIPSPPPSPDPAPVAPLLPEHAGPHFRGRLQRPRPRGGGAGRGMREERERQKHGATTTRKN
jgi:hypothetical protein